MKSMLFGMLSPEMRKETEHYINRFRDMQNGSFAVTKISGACMNEHLDEVLEGLSVVNSLGLKNVVIFGWGDLLTERLKASDHPVQFVHGNRVTDDVTMQHIEDIIEGYRTKIHAYDSDLADGFLKGSISATQVSEEMGRVGRVTGIDEDALMDTLDRTGVALVPPLGYDGNRYLNINADTVAASLVEHLQPHKYIALTPSGGVYDADGSLLRKVSIVDDYDPLVSQGALTGGMKKKVDEAKGLLERAKKGSCVQVTSPADFLYELFTYGGAGTKVIHGYHLSHIKSGAEYDQEKVKSLIEEAFQKKLSDEYFQDPLYLILEEDYDGVAVLKEVDDWLLMDKLAVSNKSENTGLGSRLFTEVLSCYENNPGYKGICWRTSKESLRGWYERMMGSYGGGTHKTDACRVYWVSDTIEDIPHIIHYLDMKPFDWVK